MKTTLSFDRCEGRLAVLLTDEGQQIDFPKELLPKEARPGDMLSFAIDVDREATEALKKDTKELQDRLKKTDSGKDIEL
jgi:hypothetical protein